MTPAMLSVGEYVKDGEQQIALISTRLDDSGEPTHEGRAIGLPVWNARVLRDQLTAILKNLDGEE